MLHDIKQIKLQKVFFTFMLGVSKRSETKLDKSRDLLSFASRKLKTKKLNKIKGTDSWGEKNEVLLSGDKKKKKSARDPLER